MTAKWINDLNADPEMARFLERDLITLGVSEELHRVLQDRGLRQTDLAEVMGVSEARISRLLCGENNTTLHSIADAFLSLGFRGVFKAIPLSECLGNTNQYSLRLSNTWDAPDANPQQSYHIQSA